jgi:hypothetical protein
MIRAILQALFPRLFKQPERIRKKRMFLLLR